VSAGIYFESGATGITRDHNLCNVAAPGCTVETPAFANVAAGAEEFLHLAEGSRAVGHGVDLSHLFTTDFAGAPRSTPWDMGAHAFAPPQTPVGTVLTLPFEEGQGLTAADTSGHGHTCTLQTAGWDRGIIGTSAFSLNGARACRVVGTAALRPPTTFGLSAWISTTTHARQEIVSMGDSYSLYQEADGNLSGFYYDGRTWIEVTTTGLNVADGRAHHVSLTKDTFGLRLRLDNAEVAALATTGAISYRLGPDLYVGVHGNKSSRYFTGRIDQVSVFDTPITDEQNRALFLEQTTIAQPGRLRPDCCP
jgi:hypothetical protein